MLRWLQLLLWGCVWNALRFSRCTSKFLIRVRKREGERERRRNRPPKDGGCLESRVKWISYGNSISLCVLSCDPFRFAHVCAFFFWVQLKLATVKEEGNRVVVYKVNSLEYTVRPAVVIFRVMKQSSGCQRETRESKRRGASTRIALN